MSNHLLNIIRVSKTEEILCVSLGVREESRVGEGQSNNYCSTGVQRKWHLTAQA